MRPFLFLLFFIALSASANQSDEMRAKQLEQLSLFKARQLQQEDAREARAQKARAEIRSLENILNRLVAQKNADPRAGKYDTDINVTQQMIEDQKEELRFLEQREAASKGCPECIGER